MKKFILFLFMSVAMTGFSQSDVSLKFTYNNQAVCNYEITIKAGDVALGKGTTNDNGEAFFSQVMLISKSIDVYGYKKTANGEKNFDMKGYVTLNDDFFAHIKMEELVKEMASGSGMPESMFAGAWGLTELDCGGSSAEPRPIGTENETSETIEQQPTDEGLALPTKEESLAMQEQGIKNEIALLDKKISKQETKLNELKVAGATVPEVEMQSLEQEELKLKRERKKVNLEKVQKQQQGELTSEENQTYKDRSVKLEQQEDSAKEKRKALEKEQKAEKKEAGDEMSTGDKAKEKLETGGAKLKIASIKSQIKVRESNLEKMKEKGKATPEEIAGKEKELADLRLELADLERQLEEKK